jgi:drug/metabolite transporter (DMT)-like permease
VAVEDWIAPAPAEWAAIAALGVLPLGLAIYLWDFGVKQGDIQALGAFAYVEPFVGAVMVALFTNGVLGLDLLWSGALVVGGAAIAGTSLWKSVSAATQPETAEPVPDGEAELRARRLALCGPPAKPPAR